jgi:glycosyltransferase involved in cell wall biosynthesis
MRILMVHSFYSGRQPSGENRLVEKAVSALKNADHNVNLVSAKTDALRAEIKGYGLWAARNVAFGLGLDPLREILNFRPEVVHVHNLFPNYSTHWMSHCKVPIVTTLYNYRLVCSNGLLSRQGVNCTLCPTKSSLNSLRYGCYRGSRLATLPLTINQVRGVQQQPIVQNSKRLIMISEREASLFCGFGVSLSQMAVIPYYAPDWGADRAESSQNTSWLFVGRLSEEKGILELLEEWPQNERLDLVGSGEMESRLKQHKDHRFVYHSQLSPREVSMRMRRSKGLIFSSRVFETMGSTVIEAFEAGIPVIARAGSAGADLVQATGAGVIYGTGHQTLSEALRFVSDNEVTLRKRAREAYQREFTEQVWVDRITDVYQDAIAQKQ